MSYKISFSNICEIRMGSPYNSADLSISGGFTPPGEVLRNATFQDKSAITPTGDVCYLLEWQTAGNNPAFQIWRLSSPEKNVKKSPIIPGCCQSISSLTDGSGVELTVWNYSSDKQQLTVRDFS